MPYVFFAFGFLLGSLFEYAYHRFVLHARRPQWRLVRSHQEHHRAVLRGTRDGFFSPLAPLALLAFVIGVWAFWGGGWLWWWFGLAAYYFCFELVHWLVHRSAAPRWLGWHCRRHQAHHHHPRSHYNVVLPLGDWLLGRK